MHLNAPSSDPEASLLFLAQWWLSVQLGGCPAYDSSILSLMSPAQAAEPTAPRAKRRNHLQLQVLTKNPQPGQLHPRAPASGPGRTPPFNHLAKRKLAA